MTRLKVFLRPEALILIVVGLLIPNTMLAHPNSDEKTPTATNEHQSTDLTDLDSLISKADDQGGVRILAELAIPFKPESYSQQQSAAGQRESIQQAQQSVLAGLDGHNAVATAEFQYIPYIGLELDARALVHLATLPEIRSIQEELLLFPALDSTLPVIGANWSRSSGFTGAGQTIAILDTGIDPTHPFVNGGGSRIVSEACYSTTSTLDGSSSVCPGGAEIAVGPGTGSDCVSVVGPARPRSLLQCEHGTHVAGIAAGNDGQRYGVAPEASLISIQVFSAVVNPDTCGNFNECLTAYTTDIILGLERVFELNPAHEIAAVNMSLGGGKFGSICPEQPAMAMVEVLATVGIQVIAATGNDGEREAIGTPACIPGVVSVGNTTDDDQVSISSNISWFTDLLAPGTGVRSSIPLSRAPDPTNPYSGKTGSSMSAPHVAGAWALLRQAYPNELLVERLTRLVMTGTLVDDQRFDGVVNDRPRINVDFALATHVDIDALALVETGHPLWPFDTIQEAAVAVPDRSMLRISPGNYNELITIDRPMELHAKGGLVTIGTP